MLFLTKDRNRQDHPEPKIKTRAENIDVRCVNYHAKSCIINDIHPNDVQRTKIMYGHMRCISPSKYEKRDGANKQQFIALNRNHVVVLHLPLVPKKNYSVDGTHTN